jgi:hypothetical protein
MKFSGFFAISVGIMMFAQWAFFLATGQVPDLNCEPWRIGLHQAAEFITAAGLVIGGVGIIRRTSWESLPVFRRDAALFDDRQFGLFYPTESMSSGVDVHYLVGLVGDCCNAGI